MRALALDVGSKTIGLALSDESGLLASAWGVHARRGHQKDAAEILRKSQEEGVEVIVVGQPLELNGSVGHRARLVGRFVAVLRQKLEEDSVSEEPVYSSSLRIELWDERFSTASAERTLLEADVSRKKRKQKIDALAAQFILQGWLDAQKEKCL